MTRDIGRIEVVYAHTFAPVVSAYIVGPVATIVAWAVFGPEVGAAIGIPLFISLFVVPYLGIRSSFANTRVALANTRVALQRRRDLSHHISDSVFGLNTVLSYGLEDERLGEMSELGDQIAKPSAVARDWAGIRRGANVTLSLFAVIAVVLVALPDVTPALVAALAAATLRLFEGPRGVEDSASYLDHSLAAARRLYQISHAPAVVTDGPRTLSLHSAPRISFEDVSYTYPGVEGGVTSPSRVLRDVSFDIPAGGHGILVGRSGSGKSTLAQLLVRYDDPDQGRILINGEPVSEFDLDSLRTKVLVLDEFAASLNVELEEQIRTNLRQAYPNMTVLEVTHRLKALDHGDVVAVLDGGDLMLSGAPENVNEDAVEQVMAARVV